MSCWILVPSWARVDARLNGGGSCPGDGLPPPSRKGLVLNPNCTTKFSSIREIRCARGREDGRSLTGSLWTTWGSVEAIVFQDIVGLELIFPMSWSFFEMAPAKPNIIGGGYLLRSEDFMSSGKTWSGWLHFSPSQQQMSKSEDNVVDLATNWPSRRWSNLTRWWPTEACHARNTLVAHKEEQRCAEGEPLHSTGSCGCSKKEAVGCWECCFIRAMRNISRSTRRLSLSTSCCSDGCSASKPQTKSSERPRTGGGALGLGNHLKIDHVRQFGPPPTSLTLPSIAAWQRCPYGWSANKSCPRACGGRRVSKATMCGDSLG